MKNYQEVLKNHYASIWGGVYNVKNWIFGPMLNDNPDFCVLEFPPSRNRNMWTYATCGMSINMNRNAIELNIFSSVQDECLIELLTIVAHYHITGTQLKLDDTVRFGKPWQGSSTCTCGLISLPYLDGPKLENVPMLGVKCYWLIPITEKEREFKIKYGIEELEKLFEENNFNYLDDNRTSLI